MSLSLELIHPPSSGLCPCQEKPRLWRKNSESREQSLTRLNYAKAHPVLRKPKNLCRLNIEYFPVE